MPQTDASPLQIRIKAVSKPYFLRIYIDGAETGEAQRVCGVDTEVIRR